MTLDIIKGVSVALNQVFRDGFEIYFSNDVQQGLKEPCFFITIMESSRVRRIGQRYRQDNSLAVQYFPETQYGNSEMMGVAERLFDVLEVIQVPDGDQVRGTAMNYNIQDGVLHFFVDYNVFLKKEPDFDEMETLTIDTSTA